MSKAVKPGWNEMPSFISEGLPFLEKWPVPPSVSVPWKEEVNGEQGLDEGPCSVPASCLCPCGSVGLSWAGDSSQRSAGPPKHSVSLLLSHLASLSPAE